MRLKWLRTALRNLDQEAAHIAVDDVVTARLVVKRVLDAVALLGEQPELGRAGENQILSGNGKTSLPVPR